MQKWYEHYNQNGLTVIGVHTPEFEFEHQKDNLAGAVQNRGITFPVVQDNKFETWHAYNNRYWPAVYLIDKQARLVYTHFGEGQYQETENNIRFLLEG